MKFLHWHHFLSLEKDFINTLEYVELDQANNRAFSIVYTKLILGICSEIDVIAKLLCKSIDSTSTASNINQYRKEIIEKYPNFHTVEALIPRYSLKVSPWLNWSTDKSPDWWKAHNDVKHERNTYFMSASQKNVKEALCALFCILLYFYQPEVYASKLQPSPELLDYDGMPGHLLFGSSVELPDIPR